MTTTATLNGFETVEFEISNGIVTIRQPGDQAEPDVIVVPLQHFWAFAEAISDLADSVKQMGYR